MKINALNNSLSGQTGTGKFVGTHSPSLTTPHLGVPASGDLSNCINIAGAASYVFLEAQTASDDATILFSGIGSYVEYIVFVTDVQLATDFASLQLQTSTTNGSTWDDGGSDYSYAGISIINNTGNVVDSAGANNIAVSSGILESSYGYAAQIRMSQIPSSNFIVNCMGIGSLHANGGYYAISGVRLAVTTVNAFRFLASSGNISSGKFELYGTTGGV